MGARSATCLTHFVRSILASEEARLTGAQYAPDLSHSFCKEEEEAKTATLTLRLLRLSVFALEVVMDARYIVSFYRDLENAVHTSWAFGGDAVDTIAPDFRNFLTRGNDMSIEISHYVAGMPVFGIVLDGEFIATYLTREEAETFLSDIGACAYMNASQEREDPADVLLVEDINVAQTEAYYVNLERSFDEYKKEHYVELGCTQCKKDGHVCVPCLKSPAFS